MNNNFSNIELPETDKTHYSNMGVSRDNCDFVVALAGNPNTGKSTIFNALTGLKQHTGNWPGKTVTRAEGIFKIQDKKYKIIDLPGTYSLLSSTEDEEIARDFLLFGKPDVTVVTIDATMLEQNLNLTYQVMEITDKIVVCLNLIDEAKRKGIFIDAKGLSSELGIPVIPTIARDKTGLDKLTECISKVASNEIKNTPHKLKYDNSLQNAVDKLIPQIEDNYPDIENKTWLALRLLEGDKSIVSYLRELNNVY